MTVAPFLLFGYLLLSLACSASDCAAVLELAFETSNLGGKPALLLCTHPLTSLDCGTFEIVGTALAWALPASDHPQCALACSFLFIPVLDCLLMPSLRGQGVATCRKWCVPTTVSPSF